MAVGEIVRRVLSIDMIFFSLPTSDEDVHAPNQFFRLRRFHDGIRAWMAYVTAAGREWSAQINQEK